MERRTLLKGIAVLGLGAALPLKKAMAGRAAWMDVVKRPFHRFMLGQLELTIITDGHIVLSPVQPNFPDGTEQAEKDLLRSHFRSTESVDLGMNILLVKKGDELILIDTGTGGAFGKDGGWLLQSMADAGVKPEHITAVVISHAHPDHIGGLLTKEDKPVFEGARVYISRLEHAFWTAEQQDFSRSKFQDKALLRVLCANAKKALNTLSSRLQLFEDGAVLFDCMRMEIAPGHTPGHAVTHVFSGSEELVHVADLLHSDLISVQHPEWGFNGDSDIVLAVATRKRVLSKLAADRVTVFGYHLPWPGLGHIKAAAGGMEWTAEVFAYPA